MQFFDYSENFNCLMFEFFELQSQFRRMSKRTNQFQSKYDQQQNSQQRNSSSKSKEHRSKPTLSKKCQQNTRKHFVDMRNQNNSKDKSCSEIVCEFCSKLKNKIKQKEEQFCKVIQLHRAEMEALNKSNQDLREQLERISQKLKSLELQVQKFREHVCGFQTGERISQLTSFSPIEQKKKPIALKIICDKLSQDAGPTTLSQLLAATPQPSQLGPNPLQPGEKQNALRSQFQRLMNECMLAESKSKKTTLRRQLALIANQLSTLQNQAIEE